MQANAAVDRELRNEALVDLCARVDDWKNHRVDHFGDLLLHGHFPVVTGKAEVQKEVRPRHSTLTSAASIRSIKATVGSKCKAALKSRLRSNSSKLPSSQTSPSGIQRLQPTPLLLTSVIGQPQFSSIPYDQHPVGNQHTCTRPPSTQFANGLGSSCPQLEQYTIYLFERILLCCKEINPNKSKEKLMGAPKDKKDKKDKKREFNKNAKLQLKGRIFMTNVTEVLSLAKQGNMFNSTLLVITLK
jgi:cell division control protein 24